MNRRFYIGILLFSVFGYSHMWGQEVERMQATIRGRVLSSQGDYLGGVIVQATPGQSPFIRDTPSKEKPSPKSRRSKTFQTKTDKDGRYRFQVPIATEGQCVALTFEKNGYKVSDLTADYIGQSLCTWLSPGQETFQACVLEKKVDVPVADDEETKLSLATLSGRVVDTHGEPLPSTLVRAVASAIDMRHVHPGSGHKVFETRTGEDGRYEMQVPVTVPKQRVSIDAMKPGYRSASGTFKYGGHSKTITVFPATSGHASFILPRALYVSGRVVDDDGKPIAGVEITAAEKSSASVGYITVVTTPIGGTFEIFDYPLTRSQYANPMVERGEIEFIHPHFVRRAIADVYALPKEERADLQIVLSRGHRIEGVVVDVAGEPVDSLMVEAIYKDKFNRKAALTDAQGRFALKGLPSGDMVVRAHALECHQKSSICLKLVSDLDDFELHLQPAPLPADLNTVSVFGMKLVAVDARLYAIYDLPLTYGVLVLDPGKSTRRLGVEHLAAGDCIVRVEHTPVADTRQFVTGILDSTKDQKGPQYWCRIAYTFNRADSTGTNTKLLRLSKDHLASLRNLLPLLKRTRPSVPYLGIDISSEKPCIVSRVFPGSPAAKCGLQQTDVIVEIGGQQIEGFHSLREAVGKMRPGKSVKICIRRGNTTQQLNVTF